MDKKREPYVCPLLMIANSIQSKDSHCIGNDCAWWHSDYYYSEKHISIGYCAMLKIAKALAEDE